MHSPENDSAALRLRNENPTLREIFARRKLLLLSALLIAATLLLYGPAATHQFINFDDDMYVTDNPHVITGFSIANVRWAFTEFQAGLYHPLTWLSHMLDCQLFGLNPASHHYVNVLLHAVNVLLLFVLLAKVTKSTWRSFIVAGLFAVHPLNVESVAWVAERKTLLCAFFCLLMFAVYVWYAKARSWYRYLVLVAAFILALLAKAMAVTMPVALLILDYWPLGRFFVANASEDQSELRPASFWRTACKLVLEKLPLFLICAASSYLAIIAQRSAGALSKGIPLSFRLANAITAYATYLRMAVWPTGLSIFHPLPDTILVQRVVFAFVVMALITAVAFYFRRQRYIAAGWIFFLVALLPVIGIVQIGAQAMADRYAYTPLIGIFIAVVWGLADLRERLRIKPAVTAIATLCILSAFMLVTHKTLSYWQDSLTLFTRAEQVAGKPDETIETNLGEAYDKAGLSNIAIHHFAQAEQITAKPDQKIESNLAYARAGLSEFAMQHFKTALAADPHSALALYDEGTYLMQHGQMRESIPMLLDAVTYSKSLKITISALHNLGSAHLFLAEYQPAEGFYTRALQLDPNRPQSLIGRGRAFYGDNKFEDAANDFSRAIQITRNPQLNLWLGKALEGQHKNEQAMAAYNAVLSADPESAEAKAQIAALQKSMASPPPPHR